MTGYQSRGLISPPSLPERHNTAWVGHGIKLKEAPLRDGGGTGTPGGPGERGTRADLPFLDSEVKTDHDSKRAERMPLDNHHVIKSCN